MSEKDIGQAGIHGSIQPAEATGSQSTSDTTASSGGRRGRGRPVKAEEENILGVAAVEAEEAKRLERNAKRRAKYAENKNKPKKTKKTSIVNTTDVAHIIGAVSNVIATRDNMSHWALKEDEIDRLAVPLTNIIGNTGILEEMSEHADSIALITACFTIFAPRIAVTYTNYKLKKELINAGSNKLPKPADKPGENKKGQDKQGNPGDNRNAAGTAQDVSNEQLYLGAAYA